AAGPRGGRAGPPPGPPCGPPWPSPGPPAALLLLPRTLLTLRGLGGGPAHAGNRRHPGDATAAEHLPHHLLAFLEPDDQVVHLADGGAGALSDARPPGPVEDLRVAPLARGHRVHDRRGAVQVSVPHLAAQFLVLRRPAQHPEQVPDPAQLAYPR